MCTLTWSAGGLLPAGGISAAAAAQVAADVGKSAASSKEEAYNRLLDELLQELWVDVKPPPLPSCHAQKDHDQQQLENSAAALEHLIEQELLSAARAAPRVTSAATLAAGCGSGFRQTVGLGAATPAERASSAWALHNTPSQYQWCLQLQQQYQQLQMIMEAVQHEVCSMQTACSSC